MEELFKAKMKWHRTKVGDTIEVDGKMLRIIAIYGVEFHSQNNIDIYGVGVPI